MELRTLLGELEALESEMESLYSWLAELFESDHEAAGMFFQLSLQERNHVNLVRFEATLVKRAPRRTFADVATEGREIRDLLADVRRFRASDPPPTLAAAVRFTLHVEGDPLEHLHRDLTAQVSSTVAEVMARLAADDRQHSERLQEFALHRGLL